ncbi:DNA gyrase inhibitor YacG [Aliiglaciecola lipolytica]|uniref:DNA gyrase inhibitor YacG n=1 Tax=Aliiglaciecola lipolytica E3 TaxID=1127673 RepID=K6YP96_9ALTE|nr:DNA gyrase inhibitor YacG [Aliiglaciecola lipolytica]GAC13165.1 zinc-binding protein [Aliiglaciecola lipolytica E3]
MEVSCPTCKKKVEWNDKNLFRPFCCKRCQLIDLGEWSNEEKVISTSTYDENANKTLPDIEDIEAMLAQQQQDFFKDK